MINLFDHLKKSLVLFLVFIPYATYFIFVLYSFDVNKLNLISVCQGIVFYSVLLLGLYIYIYNIIKDNKKKYYWIELKKYYLIFKEKPYIILYLIIILIINSFIYIGIKYLLNCGFNIFSLEEFDFFIYNNIMYNYGIRILCIPYVCYINYIIYVIINLNKLKEFDISIFSPTNIFKGSDIFKLLFLILPLTFIFNAIIQLFYMEFTVNEKNNVVVLEIKRIIPPINKESDLYLVTEDYFYNIPSEEILYSSNQINTEDNYDQIILSNKNRNIYNLCINNFEELRYKSSLTKVDQLKFTESLIIKYEEEVNKFTRYKYDILNGTEEFYPEESIKLWDEYVEFLKNPAMLAYLKSRCINLEEEVRLDNFQLSGLNNIKDVFGNLERREEIIFSEIEDDNDSPEDYMEDINKWGMFNENSELIDEDFSSEDYMNDFIKLGIFDENSD